jgi:hypothetical protein
MVEKLRQRSLSRSQLVSDLKIQIDLCGVDNLSPEQKTAMATMTNLLAKLEQVDQS